MLRSARGWPAFFRTRDMLRFSPHNWFYQTMNATTLHLHAYGIQASKSNLHELARLHTLVSRQTRLQAMWNDQAVFDGIVMSDRYVKLSDATFQATEAVERHARQMLRISRQRLLVTGVETCFMDMENGSGSIKAQGSKHNVNY
jgi:hypothetical protein